ncbi:MAG TPA: aminotransferase, partial [Balneolaceae bacterium]|nr:aminotransferase [Balneolaceae bacterium]
SDALICAGYKWLMGPYSIGLAYYGPALDDGNPVEENWINRYESENFANLVNYNDEYQPGALRYEVGEHSNFILVPMMLKAVQQLNQWGVENIQG